MAMHTNGDADLRIDSLENVCASYLVQFILIQVKPKILSSSLKY